MRFVSRTMVFSAAFFSASCTGPLDRNNPADPEGTNFVPTPIPTKRIFATSTTTGGNMGGLAGADAICQGRANAQALGGTWKAWLSTTTLDAVDRMPEAVWNRIDGSSAFSTTAAIRSGTAPLALLNLDEAGIAVGGTTEAYTGTQSNGTVTGTSTCNNWIGSSSSPGSSRTGETSSLANWTEDGNTTNACLIGRHIYCFEQ